MDLILGTFADKYVPGFSDAALTEFDEILNHSDPDLYNWITGVEQIPANYLGDVMGVLLKHRFAS